MHILISLSQLHNFSCTGSRNVTAMVPKLADEFEIHYCCLDIQSVIPCAADQNLVITVQLSGFVNGHTLRAFYCRTDVVSCILDQEPSMSAVLSAKSKLRRCTSPDRMMPLLSVVLLSYLVYCYCR